MTRKEYLELTSKPSGHERRANEREHPCFLTLDEYLVARRKCERYEENTKISDQLTKEDYEMFDRNFQLALNDILYKDDGIGEDDVDKTITMMEAVDWGWVNDIESQATVPDRDRFISLVKYCYETCLDSGRARGMCATGGITVETDILDHFVSIRFDSFDTSAFDGDDNH